MTSTEIAAMFFNQGRERGKFQPVNDSDQVADYISEKQASWLIGTWRRENPGIPTSGLHGTGQEVEGGVDGFRWSVVQRNRGNKAGLLRVWTGTGR